MDPSDSKLDSPERRRSRRTSVRHSLTLRTERMDEFPDPEDPALASVADHDMRHSLSHDPSPAVVALGQELRDEGLGQGGRHIRARVTTTSPTSTPILPVQPFSQAESRPAQESLYGANAGMAATAPLPALTTLSPELPQAPLRPPSPTKPASSAADPLALRHDGATSPNLSSQHMGMDAAYSASVHGPTQPSGPSHVYEQYTRNLPFGPPLGLSSDPLPRGYPYHGPSDPSPYHIYPQDVHNAPQYGRVVTQQGEVPVVDYYSPYGHHEPLPPYTERDNTGLGGSSSNSVDPSPAPVTDSTPSIGPSTAFTAVVSSSAPASAPESSPALGPDSVEEVPEGRIIPTAQPTQPPLPSTQTLPTPTSPTTRMVATAHTGHTEETGPAAQSAQAEVLTGAGGLGLATRNPEFDSLDDLRAPRPRASTRSFNSTHSNDQIDREKAVLSEKETPFKRWMRKQWCFGVVPNWALVLSLCLLVIVGIVAGTVAGVLLSNHGKPPSKEGHPKPASGTTFPSNVVPIPTPTDLAPLPTGTWSIPMMLDKASSNCFKDPTQSKSWDCHFVPSGMYLSVEHSAPNGYTFTINCNHSLTMSKNVYSYGEQPALLVNTGALVLVNDMSEANRGPAWFQAVPYNKTVILPHDSLNLTTAEGAAKIRRGWDRKDYNQRKGNGAQPGDKPWICNWPQTTFELYIFAQQNSSWSVNTESLPPPSVTSSVPASTDSTTMTVVVTKTEIDHVASPTASTLPSSTWPPDRYNHYITKSLGQRLWDGDVYHHPHKHRQFEADHHGQESFSSGTFSSTSGPAPSFASGLLGTSPRGDGFAPPPPGYPRVIKLEERRYPDAPVPECTQFEILSNGQAAKPVRDEKGNMVVVTMYPPEATETGSPRSSRRLDKRLTDWDLDLDEDDDSPIWSPEVLRRGEGDGGMSYASGGAVPFGSQCNCEWFVT